MPTGTRRGGKKGKSDGKLDSSKSSTTSSYREGRSSTNSSYRDKSQNEADSSQDSQSLDDSQEDGDNLDYTDEASHISSRSPLGSARESPSYEDHSPYNLRSRRNFSPGSSSFHSDYNSPDRGLRTASSPIAHAASSPLTRGPLHPKDRSPGTPLQAMYETRRPKKDNDDKTNKNDFISNLLALPISTKCGICGVLLFLFVVVFFIVPGKNVVDDTIMKGDLNEREMMVYKFEKYFKVLMPKFPSQSTRTWKVLKAATKRVLRESKPHMPSVILIVANKEAFDTVDCLAKKFATVVAQAYSVKSPAVITQDDVSVYSNNPDNLKLYLDKTLNNALQNEKVVIIENIDKIPGQAAMIFHSYCDNEFAPFKDSVIILTMHIDDSDDELTSDSEIENYLESKWESELDKDKRAALIYSRLGNNIALVNKEDNDDLKNICH